MTKAPALEGLDRFLKMYDTESCQLDTKMDDLIEEIRQLQEKSSSITKTLNERQVGHQQESTHEERLVSILLDAKEEGNVNLNVFYVVSNASWKPKYDVRTYIKDGRMQLHYFGVIQQSTGEDWKDAHISLSTAVPSVGGTPPSITAKNLSLAPKGGYYRASKKKNKAMRSRGGLFGGSMRSQPRRRMVEMNLASNGPGGGGDESSDSDSGDEEMGMTSAEVQTGFITTAFEIEKPATIPADNTGHKVLVSIISLRPFFSYESVPKLSARAFLKAKVKNDSPFALLAGPTNIFLEDNFVAKSKIVAVSPQEEFECSLGVDPSVRVTYKPVQKFREHGGFMSKMTVFKFRQVIEVKNTQPESIKIKIFDQLPLSTEEKIKVQLVEPEVKKPERGKSLPADAFPRLNNSNNIEWQLSIASGEKKELVLRYTVEYPTEQGIEGL